MFYGLPMTSQLDPHISSHLPVRIFWSSAGARNDRGVRSVARRGIAYAEKLARAGVTVDHLHADDQMHGFLMLSRAVTRAGQLVDHLADVTI